MLKIYTSEEIKDIIINNEMAILYFSNELCGACEVIRNKIYRILESYSKVKMIEIDGEKQIDISAIYDVFSFPLVLLYVDGKETIRVGRNVDLLELEKSIKRYYDMLF